MHFNKRLQAQTEIRVLDDSRFEHQLGIVAGLPELFEDVHANQYHLCLTYPESKIAVIKVYRATIFENLNHRPTQILVLSQSEDGIVGSATCRSLAMRTILFQQTWELRASFFRGIFALTLYGSAHADMFQHADQLNHLLGIEYSIHAPRREVGEWSLVELPNFHPAALC